MDSSDRDLLYKIARAYYGDNETQLQVSRRFGLSRIKVSRMLKRAREAQIVEITVHPPEGSFAEAERRLAEMYGLDEILIVRSSSFGGSAVLVDIAHAAAGLLTRVLDDGQTLAVGWGATLSATAEALTRRNMSRTQVIQMLGGLGSTAADVHGADIARRIAASLGAHPRLLPAPGIVAERSVRDALMSDPQIYDTLQLASRADVALVGIGIPTATSIVAKAGTILGSAEISGLRRRGAVGDISLRFFDENGQGLALPLDQRIIGLELDQIRSIPRVIAVAGGMEKYTAIRAALRGELLHTLVTDVFVARRLLEEGERNRMHEAG